jgi:hypothetical protein
VTRVEPQPRALPAPDLETIFSVVATVHGELLAGSLPPDLVRRLIGRATGRGQLPDGASPGELNAVLADLCQRLHWAMGHGAGYPAPAPRRTTYHLDIPDHAADACAAELAGLGGTVHMRHAEPGRRHIDVDFPDLPPDPGHRARVAQLSALAERHGGEFTGFGA